MSLLVRMIRSNLDRNPMIRAIDLTESFYQEDLNALTAEEKQEVEQLHRDGQLRRNNPSAYPSLMAQRRQDQYSPYSLQGIAPRGTPQEHGIHIPNASLNSYLVPVGLSAAPDTASQAKQNRSEKQKRFAETFGSNPQNPPIGLKEYWTSDDESERTKKAKRWLDEQSRKRARGEID